MKLKMSKGLISMLIVALILAISLLNPACAQLKKKTYAYINAIPNPVQVNQPVLLHVGITDYLRVVTDGWQDLSVEIVRPDGQTEWIKGIRTDSTGGTGVLYTPTMVGTYKLRTHFPEQTYYWPSPPGFAPQLRGNVTYLASTSDWLELIVQAEPLPTYPGISLPSEYWTRPIDSQAREWYSIAGSWLYTPDNLYAPYNDGPETPHILWTRPFTLGGLVGGDVGLETSINQGPVGMETGDAYEGKWSSPLILMGRLYHQAGAYDRPRLWYCVDLHTGELLWAKTFLDNQTIAFGQLYYWQSYNYMGTFAYLWVTVGTTWTAFDAYTGNLMAQITNVPSGTTLRDSNGGLYRLQINIARGWMALWNLSALVSMAGSWGSQFCLRQYNASNGYYRSMGTTGAWGSWVTSGASDRVKRSWSWNVSIPTGLPGSLLKAFFGDRVIGGLANQTHVILWGLSLKPGEVGRQLFYNVWKAPSEWLEGLVTVSWVAWSQEDKIGVLWVKEPRQHYGFSLETGQYLWGPTPSQNYLDALEDTVSGARAIAYGKLYSASVSGIVYCYDVKTGKLLWTYEAIDPYKEQLWNRAWWLRPLFITDGKLYVGHYEHSANQPLPRGAPFICLNATTGDVIFRVDGLFRQSRWGGRAIIGDSIIATQDTYDQRVYAIGKGPTQTTVEAPSVGVSVGQAITIRGKVIDISPGTRDTAIQLRFPNGVPAVADECMGDWMLYVYKQFPRPTGNMRGVWVKLDAVNVYTGEYIDIGGTHTDPWSGMFTVSWQPPKEGLWWIIASFPGSKSYWPSCAQTPITVTAPTPTPTPASPEQVQTIQTTIEALGPQVMSVMTVLVVLVFIAIILGAANLYMYLKRK
ncbi:MAG: PQQ-binding-like beta-propeller repeat protein [Candidatus Bathyarchaeia archaeon]